MIPSIIHWNDLSEAAEAVGRARGWDIETEAVTLRYAAIERELRALGAAVIGLEEGFLAVVRTDARRAHVITPEGHRIAMPLRELRDRLCADVEAKPGAEIDRLMGNIRGRLKPALRLRMLRELVGDAPVGNIQVVRPRLEDVRAVMRDAGLLKKALAFLAMNAGEMLLYVLSWWVLGLMAFDTRSLDTLFALWLLTAITIVPLRAGGVAAARSLVVELSSAIKRRVLLGALKLSPDEVNGKGVGTFLSHVLESAQVEAMGTSGAFAGVTSLIAGIAAIYVMGRGAGGAAHVALYLLFLAAAVVLTVRFGLGRAGWTEARFALTGHVVENMTGHKTRLTQKEPHERNEGEDVRLERYMAAELVFNRPAMQLDVLRRMWTWAGLLALAPVVAAGSATTESLAVSAAGVLLGGMALTQWTDASANIAGALSAWRRIAPFWRAADRTAPQGSPAMRTLLENAGVPPAPLIGGGDAAGPAGGTPAFHLDALPLVHASALTYRHARRDVAALEQVDLTIRRGERILLRGPSGSGKSTLSALLSGVRPLQSGLLFFRGLDVATVGLENWRRRVLLAPQFHANHIFIGTLAYNLLLGRGWPASAAEREEALEVCRALGLGPLVERMPLGLDQPVGETGWQLSHGERTRVFLARSILQKPALMILDETFSALDPKTLNVCMRYVLERADTLLVIAHP
jgi:ATP-binding cassette subfamily B protein